METAQLKVVSRSGGSNRSLKEIRGQGLVPAVIYGPGLKNQNCAFSERELRKAIGSSAEGNVLFNRESETAELKGKQVLVKNRDRDPLTGRWIHADLYEVAKGQAIVVSVPLAFKGVPDGVRNGGGIFQVLRRSVRIRGLVADIPKTIEVDVTELAMGSSIHISDVKFSEKLKVLDAGQFTLAAVVEAEKEEVVVAAAPTAEAGAGTGAASAATTAAAGDAAKAAEPAKKAEAAKK